MINIKKKSPSIVSLDFSRKEEFYHALTHGIGFVFSVAAYIVLIVNGVAIQNVLYRLSFNIYGISLIILYAASTLYHGFLGGKTKHMLESCDHAAIFLLIAGTYTPFLLLGVHGIIGWVVFIVVWAIALAGVVFKILLVKKFRIITTIVYLVMGWLITIVIKPLYTNLNIISLVMLFAGGILYSVGTIFYLNRSIPYNHVIWHIFVLGGSVSHFFAIYFLIQYPPI